MKEILDSLGWKCSRCGCPGIVGYDCAHSQHRGVIIQIRDKRFKIIRQSKVIESAFGYELKEKLQGNDLL